MEFKIDTRDTFCIITPVIDRISAKMTGELEQQRQEMRQSGSKNFIVDLQHCAGIDKPAINDLVAIHEDSYGQEESLVFTGISKEVMNTLKEDETDLLINIARKMDEAVDIITMEILERDLFKEE
jgi:anti-sigma B factor antagonist